jgi:hypothetical protein
MPDDDDESDCAASLNEDSSHVGMLEDVMNGAVVIWHIHLFEYILGIPDENRQEALANIRCTPCEVGVQENYEFLDEMLRFVAIGRTYYLTPSQEKMFGIYTLPNPSQLTLYGAREGPRTKRKLIIYHKAMIFVLRHVSNTSRDGVHKRLFDTVDPLPN